ncbi:DUF4363 family protein [Clostridium bovifaecis]|uniref:DUF4363 family protein n=1 Tax=Clostridium bovifaecis TaxID=2184719 RepID=A0A6I6ER00_9CLOT|nr:DUF4363 family protein [Clostridium bovifaecis]
MKNLVASFMLFIALVITMVFSMRYLENKCGYYTDKIDALETIIVNESWEEAYNSSIGFLEEWKKDSSIVPTFINHIHVETITNSVLKLTQYTKYKDKVDSLATIHEIKFLLEEMMEIEKVTLPNVF